MAKHFALPALAALAMTAAPAWAVDWTQFRGPNHDGASPEKISKHWPAGGPAQVWKTPLNDGFSGIVTGGGKAFTLVLADVDGASQECCVALDAGTGAQAWSQPLGVAKYDQGGNRGAPDNSGGDGPRSTPSYDNGRVYAYSSRMILKCFDAATGKPIWSHDIIHEFSGQNIHWESAASPLVDDGVVYVAGGGAGEALLAFDEADGHVIWKAEDDRFTHSTPVAATILGQRQIVFFTQKGLVSVEPKTGAVLWRYPYRYNVSAAMSPVVHGDIVYCSAAYGVGSGACKISKANGTYSARELWSKPGNDLVNHWSTPVCKDGCIYGIFGQAEFGTAPLECVELATGNVRWSQPGFGPGGCTLVDGNVLALTDSGDLALVKATPDGYTEIARSHVLSGKCWNAAGISNGRIYARSVREGVSLNVSTP